MTASLAGGIGVVTLVRVKDPRARLLAAMPLLFGIQQGIEGLLWLNLPTAPDGSISSRLTLLFLLFAEALWPIYAPAAVLLIEPNASRRRLLRPCLALGVAVGAYLASWIVSQQHGAVILDDHIVYVSALSLPSAVALGYLISVSLPLMLSSQRTVISLGTIVLVGAVIAYIFYREAFVSVWCFFAAAASVMILYHFERSRRLGLGLTGV